MKSTIRIFWGLTVFFLVVTVAYAYLTITKTGQMEWVGAPALLLTAGLCAMPAAYLGLTNRRIDPMPEDDVEGKVEEHAGEQGFFSPYSWWPLPLAFSAGLIFLGAAVGWWISLFGVVLGAVMLVGWVYEYYRGAHAH